MLFTNKKVILFYISISQFEHINKRALQDYLLRFT